MTKYNLERLKVLVVDDNQYMHKIVKTLLGAMGITSVRGILCSTDIFKEMETWLPDLIIIDHIMEPVTGIELIRQIRHREEDAIRFIPIILLTGNADQQVVLEGRFDAGADMVLVKPVSAARLFSTIVSLYENPRTFVEMDDYVGPERRRRDRPFDGQERRNEPAAAAAPKESAPEQDDLADLDDFDDLEFVPSRQRAGDAA